MLSPCFSSHKTFISSYDGTNSIKRDLVIAGINKPVVELCAVGLTGVNIFIF